MDARLSLITLGVASIDVSRQFYEKLGFVASTASTEDIVFFQLGTVGLALYSRALLASDANVQDSVPGFSGITIAYNARDRHEVDIVLEQAVLAGGRIVKAAQNAFWGGYSGYFADPDKHLWEVAHNPFFEVMPDGALRLP